MRLGRACGLREHRAWQPRADSTALASHPSGNVPAAPLCVFSLKSSCSFGYTSSFLNEDLNDAGTKDVLADPESAPRPRRRMTPPRAPPSIRATVPPLVGMTLLQRFQSHSQYKGGAPKATISEPRGPGGLQGAGCASQPSMRITTPHRQVIVADTRHRQPLVATGQDADNCR